MDKTDREVIEYTEDELEKLKPLEGEEEEEEPTETEVEAEAASASEVARIMQEATESEAPDWGFSGGDIPAGEMSEVRAPKKTRKSKLGGEVSVEMAELFTPDGVGAILADAMNGFYQWCDAEPMTEESYKASKKIWAYYLQQRAPEGSGRFQPELLLFVHLASVTLPRMPQIAAKTSPWYKKAWAKVKGLFSGKPTRSTQED